MILRPAIRLCLCLVLASMASACSTVPDRYAPWRDNDSEATAGGHKPNLGDVPAAPNVDNAKAQIEEMRQRMEADRQNAYLSSQGIVPQDNNTISPPAGTAPINNNAPPVTDSDLAPPTNNSNAISSPVSNITSTPLAEPAPQSAQQSPQMMAGNVYYNYDPNAGNDYSYGYGAATSPENVDINLPTAVVASNDASISSDPSVAIDLSVLGGAASSPVRNKRMPSSGGITTGEPIAYFSHGSAKLGTKDRTAIRQLASQLKQRPQPIMLAGNSSRRTGLKNSALSKLINLKMSERRANAVMDELVKQGVTPEQIFISAYGDAIPNRREDEGHNEAANRRVEVLFDR